MFKVKHQAKLLEYIWKEGEGIYEQEWSRSWQENTQRQLT